MDEEASLAFLARHQALLERVTVLERVVEKATERLEQADVAYDRDQNLFVDQCWREAWEILRGV